MPKEKLELIVEGGKATSTPQIAQKLGPLKINISEVMKKINDKTSSFSGVKVPLKLTIDTTSKEVDIEVGTPPVSELIKKEINIEKGSGIPNRDIKGNVAIEQVIKIADMKKDSMYVQSLKSAVKNVIGSCNSLGVYIEGEPGKNFVRKVEQGLFDKEINEIKKEPDKEKINLLKKQLKEIQDSYQKEVEKQKVEEEKAKEAAAAAAVGAAPETKEGKEAKEAAPKEEKKAEEKKKPEEKKEAKK